MRNNFYYWRSQKGGPKQGAIIFDVGYLEFDLNDQESFDRARVLLDKAVGMVWKVPADGTYTAEGADCQGCSVWTTKHGTVEAAVGAYRSILQERIAHKAYLEANPLADLEERLKSHDWHYDYSDDGRVFRAGEASFKKIRELIGKLPVDKVRELWAKHAPKNFVCPIDNR